MSVFDAPAAARTVPGRAPARSVTIVGDGSGRGATRVPMNPRARDSDDDAEGTSDDDDDGLDDDDLETSGSDEDEDGLDAIASTSALVALTGAGEGAQCVVRGADGVARGVWRCALFAEDERVESDADVAEAFGRLVAAKDKPWVVVLARGGHFAASVFDVRGFDGSGDAPKASAVAHTTSSRYVVRAKAGGRQVTKDAGGKNIKSAGSSIRRQGELALEQDMRKTLAEDWKDAVKVRGARLVSFRFVLFSFRVLKIFFVIDVTWIRVMKTDILRRTAHASSEWLWRATAVSVASAGDGGVHAKRNLYAVGRARAFASIGTFDPRAMRAVRRCAGFRNARASSEPVTSARWISRERAARKPSMRVQL